MNTQLATLAGLVAGVFAYVLLRRAKPLLRLVPVATLVLAVAMVFASINLPPFTLSFLIGASAVIAVLGLSDR